MPSQTLSLSQQQRQLMVLAPQLRQSLEMLQMPLMELRAMVQQQMETNPAIEDIRSDEISLDAAAPGEDAPEADSAEAQTLDFDKEFAVLAELDSEWRDYFYQNLRDNNYSADQEERRQFMFDSIPQTVSLQEHLVEQLNFADLPEPDFKIGMSIIGSIDEDGYLRADPVSLSEQTGADLERLEEVLAIIREFHPTGVGARDLRECLLLQLARVSQGEESELARRIVEEHLDAVAAHKLPQIASALKTGVDKVQQAVRLIRSLDPKPGRIFSSEPAGYVVPEVQVRRVDGRYVVLVDDEQLPHVRISRQYRRLMQDPDTPDEVRQYIREKVRSGVFLVKSIHQRQKTIHRIAEEIVKAQQEFLEKGISGLRPMTMSTIAEKVGVHETTVSRAVANKYMRTPQGIYEMKFFFTPGIKMADGNAMSNQTVKDLTARIVREEDPAHPLSDQEIQERLKEQGIRVARRTVAKYRLMLRIPPSHMRRRY